MRWVQAAFAAARLSTQQAPASRALNASRTHRLLRSTSAAGKEAWRVVLQTQHLSDLGVFAQPKQELGEVYSAGAVVIELTRSQARHLVIKTRRGE